MKKISIKTPFIKLDQFLKYANIFATGGEAKLFINEGLVNVNGEPCFKRGKKLKKGDKIDVFIPDENGNVSQILVFEID